METTGNLFFKKNGEEKINQFIDSEGKIFAEAIHHLCVIIMMEIFGSTHEETLNHIPKQKKIEEVVKFDFGIGSYL